MGKTNLTLRRNPSSAICGSKHGNEYTVWEVKVKKHSKTWAQVIKVRTPDLKVGSSISALLSVDSAQLSLP